MEACPTDIAVGPDGAVYVANGSAWLTVYGPDGSRTRLRIGLEVSSVFVAHGGLLVCATPHGRLVVRTLAAAAAI